MDITKTSPALGIIGGAIATVPLFLGFDPLHDCGLSIQGDVPFNIGSRIFKAITD